LTRRVDPAFVRRFLDGPFDLRPHLEESMIPLRLDAAEKDAVVAFLTEINGPRAVKRGDAKRAPIEPARIAAGRERFVSRGCPTCHLLGNDALMPGLGVAFYEAMRPRARLAPNLRYVRERIPRDVLVRFIVDPSAVDPSSAMPRQAVSVEDAERIADFLLATPIQVKGSAPKRPEVKLLKREVTYDEVHDEVLGRICVHCHMDPASNNGDGGAGNSGGLGYPGLALNLETHAGVMAGLVRDGERVSVTQGSTPLLLEVLLRRWDEAERDFRPPFADLPQAGEPTSAARPGMPLGLSPLSGEQIALVKTWLAQGAQGRK